MPSRMCDPSWSREWDVIMFREQGVFTLCTILGLIGIKVKHQFSSVQSLSCVWLFETPWTAACQGIFFLSVQFSSVPQSCLTLCDPMDCSTPVFFVITNSWSLPKLMSIKLVMPSNYLILCCPFLLSASNFSSIRVFWSQYLASGSQSIGVSASASVLPMNIQDWFPLGLTGLISMKSKGLSRVFSNTAIQKHFLSENLPISVSLMMTSIDLTANSIEFMSHNK